MEVIKSFEPSASRHVHHPGCVGDHHHSRGVKEEGRYLELNRLIPIFCGSSEIFFWENGAPIKSKIAALRKFRVAVNVSAREREVFWFTTPSLWGLSAVVSQGSGVTQTSKTWVSPCHNVTGLWDMRLKALAGVVNARKREFLCFLVECFVKMSIK